MENQLLVIAVYRFVRMDSLPERRERFRARCRDLGLKGTVLLAPEGVNCFIAGPPGAVASFKELLAAETGCPDLVYKENWAPAEPAPFERMLVKIKKEIISLGIPSVKPEERTGPAISPEELKRWYDEGREFVVLDTRNEYEIQAGTFERAESLGVDSFREFGRKVQERRDELKERWGGKPIVMFCTGGIRCEKASALMMDQGFPDVRQLDGGILNYFDKAGGAHYDGSCFVFDWRMAVDSGLKPAPRTGSNGRHTVDEGDLA